jgi:uncharacterized iron-regulated membrane protein
LTKAGIYRLVWRWHFYAGLLVAPFLFILSASGLVYLFNDEINDLFQADRRFAPPAAQALPLSRIGEAALSGYPGGKITRLDTPRGPGRSIEVHVTPAAGDPVRVFVDPGSGTVLGLHDYRTTIVGIADQLHGSLFLGDFGDAIVELAACWSFILVVTGLYLWWPRGEITVWRSLVPRWRLGGRAFWRSLHASIGVWIALLALFLIISGLPWATIWGGLFRQATEAAGIGYPTSFRAYGAPQSEAPSIGSETGGAAPWTLIEAPAPRSTGHAGHGQHTIRSSASGGVPIGLDKVAEIVATHGMGAPYRLNLPKGERGVYIVFTYPDQPQGQRSLYIDQYSGRVLGDVGYADYGWAAKAIELGIQLHMGNYFGRLNQVVMAVPCLGLIVLSLTGPYMWWLRRPRAVLGAPEIRSSAPIGAVALITLGLAVVFPLVGASLVVVGATDVAQRRLRRALVARQDA